MTVAENVRRRRLALGLKQSDLAQRMRHLGHRWSDGVVGFIERSDRKIMVDELLGLAIALECSIRDLLGPACPDRVWSML